MWAPLSVSDRFLFPGLRARTEKAFCLGTEVLRNELREVQWSGLSFRDDRIPEHSDAGDFDGDLIAMFEKAGRIGCDADPRGSAG